MPAGWIKRELLIAGLLVDRSACYTFGGHEAN
jgi:hypothetical protein